LEGGQNKNEKIILYFIDESLCIISLLDHIQRELKSQSYRAHGKALFGPIINKIQREKVLEFSPRSFQISALLCSIFSWRMNVLTFIEK
jgi:hypothetical protein